VIPLQERVHAAARPEGWQLDKLHQVFRVRRGNKNTGMKEDNLLSLSYGRIIQKDIETADGLLPDNFEGYQIVDPGNIVLRLTDLQNDKRSLRQGLATQRGIITSAYDAVEVQRDNDPRFWFYSLLALDLAKHYYSLGGGVRQSVKFADFPNDWVYRPNLATQRQIADFLDHETARIDLLIEKREKFAALVSEARNSLVARMVCGQFSETLDATRDDWTDASPKHWKSERAKVHFRERIEKSVNGSEELLTVSHITGVTTRAEKEVNMFLAESNEGYKIVHSGDIVINTMWGWMGAMGVSPHYGIISPSYGVYRSISEAFEPEYLDILLRSKPFIAEVTRRSKGIHSSRLRIYPDAFLDLRLPIPPRNEQVELLADLSRRIERENALLARNEKASALLKEFRSALISAAVTGQINVQTYARCGATDRRLDAIQEEMSA
jgi:type I restriction enzyme S subunit